MLGKLASRISSILSPEWSELRGTATGLQDLQKTCEDLQNLESEDFSRISGFAKNKRGFAKNNEDSQSPKTVVLCVCECEDSQFPK